MSKYDHISAARQSDLSALGDRSYNLSQKFTDQAKKFSGSSKALLETAAEKAGILDASNQATFGEEDNTVANIGIELQPTRKTVYANAGLEKRLSEPDDKHVTVARIAADATISKESKAGVAAEISRFGERDSEGFERITRGVVSYDTNNSHPTIAVGKHTSYENPMKASDIAELRQYQIGGNVIFEDGKVGAILRGEAKYGNQLQYMFGKVAAGTIGDQEDMSVEIGIGRNLKTPGIYVETGIQYDTNGDLLSDPGGLGLSSSNNGTTSFIRAGLSF